MPKLSIKKSIEIKAPVSKIYSLLNDFSKWTAWSPWIVMEPDANVTVATDKKSYQWQGDRVGAGNMKILDEKENKYIDCDLNFLKPFKSHATTRLELEEGDSSTVVSWSMDSRLPFFLFFMKKMTEAYIGADYERGLNMLKALAENDKVPSNMDAKGRSNFDGCKLIGAKSECNIKDIEVKMSDDLAKVWSFVSKDEANLDGVGITIYHKYDVVKGIVTYTSGFTVKSIPTDLPNDLVSAEIPNTKVFMIEHTGPYKFLGNVWSTLYSMQRNKEFVVNKKVSSFETYLNDPATTPENELITRVYFPIK